jgi:hypothetical protein
MLAAVVTPDTHVKDHDGEIVAGEFSNISQDENII